MFLILFLRAVSLWTECSKYEFALQELFPECGEKQEEEENKKEKVLFEIFQIKKMHLQIKNLLINPEMLENQNYSELSEALEEFDSQLQTVKSKMLETISELQKEERSLEEELNSFEQRQSQWDNMLEKKTQKKSNLKKGGFCRTKDSRPTEIISMEKQLDSALKLNSWTNNDHATFLKCYRKANNMKHLIKKCQTFFPQYSEVNIKDHVLWYENVLDLQDERREIIYQYSNKKNAAQQNSVKSEELLEVDPVSDFKSKQSLEKIQNERKGRFEKLQKWKLEREKIEMDKRRQDADNLLRKKKEEKQKQLLEMRQREIQKEKISSYKLLKKMNKEELESENVMGQDLNESEIRQQRLRIKKRNEEIMTKLQNRIKENRQKKVQKEEKMKKLIESSRPNLETLEIRGAKSINRPTKASNQRHEIGNFAREEAEKPDHRFKLKHTIHHKPRITPTWRKNVRA